MAANATGGSGGQSAFNNQVANLVDFADTGVQPFVEVTYTSATQGGGQTQTIKTTISGSQTKSMTISSNTVGIQTVRCLIKHPAAALNHGQATVPSEENESDGVLDGGLLTVTRNFETISAVNLQQSNITAEVVMDDDVNTFDDSTQNLFLGPLNLQATTEDFEMTRAITVFPTEENIAVRIELAGSAGQSFNGNSGGEGGKCTFTTTLLKNTEYTFKLGASVEPTSSIGRGGAGAYFYEKGRLLVAGGGGAGAGGGNAASGANSGGGGASGYSNGSVTIISSQQGGNDSSLAFAVIRLI